jgi:hypothetical protein
VVVPPVPPDAGKPVVVPPVPPDAGKPVVVPPVPPDAGKPVVVLPVPPDAGKPVVNPLPITSATMTLQLSASLNSALAAPAKIQPAFHALPVLLDEPDDQDRYNNAASARRAPQRITIPQETAGLSTQRLTVRDILARRNHLDRAGAALVFTPKLSASTASIYTPAQIRAAYDLPVLPAVGAVPTTAQAARMGAGQTIYISSVNHDPNLAAELAVFNAKYGLPTCTTVNIPAKTQLPLPAASTTNPGCTLSVVFSRQDGGMTDVLPDYVEGWHIETALDVQWAHATAPLARIIVIEGADETSYDNFLGTIKLANAMGPGALSMSWGAGEYGGSSALESLFKDVGMTYLSSAGDDGMEVLWPAVSPHVVAVGGTTLTYSGSGARSETAWSNTGGGVSEYLPAPAYQSPSVPGLGQLGFRSVTDVSMNSDPSTGQPAAIILPGTTSARWAVVGGTSLATPEWAGIFAIAIANAMRAAVAKGPLGAPHAKLYAMAAAASDVYRNVFGDITLGANGTCAVCAARVGYDQPTGLGTPNVTAMLNFLSDAPAPLEVTPAKISGATGGPLSFTVSVNTSNPVTYTLSGAPLGLVIDATGVVTWPTPLVGSYNLTVTATDAKTNAQGSGLYAISVTGSTAPSVNPSTVYGKPGAALEVPIHYVAGALDALTFSLTGAPIGMVISSAGILSWPTPILGSYAVTVTVKNTNTVLSGSGVYTVKVQNAAVPPSFPLIGSTPWRGVAGKALSGSLSFTDPGTTALAVALMGAPLGMNFFVRDMALNMGWTSPVAGSYLIRVNVVDAAGRKTTAMVPLVVAAE